MRTGEIFSWMFCSRFGGSGRILPLRLCVVLFTFFAFLPLTGCGLQGYGALRSEVRKPVSYFVKPGDSIGRISDRTGVSVQTLMLLNGVEDPQDIHVGQRIIVGYQNYERSGTGRGSHVEGTVELVRYNQSNPQGRIAWPVRRGKVVSVFGPRWSSFHDGIDIADPEGTPVFAAHSGVVAYSGSGLSGYGRLVVIQGDDRFVTVYAHNSRILVDRGDRVRRGDPISEVGDTGHATGPHLHFEVRMRDRQGRYVALDPLPLLSGEKGQRTRYRVNESLSGLLAWLKN